MALTKLNFSGQPSIPSASMPTGSILDVYEHTSITQSGANATANYNSTGLFLTITPKSTSSKFLLTFHGTGHNNTADGFIVANIVLNPTSSTNINTVMTGGTLLTNQAYGMAHFVTPSSSFRAQLSGSILHSPNTTLPVTYNLVFKRATRGSVYWAVTSGLNILTATEIAG